MKLTANEHKLEWLQYLQDATQNVQYSFEYRSLMLQFAQVHATLAMVEKSETIPTLVDNDGLTKKGGHNPFATSPKPIPMPAPSGIPKK